MEREKFKKIVHETLLDCDYKKKGSFYYKRSDDLISTIGLQKSSYSNIYYIVNGLLLRSTNPSEEYPKYYQCDFNFRFGFDKAYENIDEIKISDFINSSLIDYVNLDGLKDVDYLKESIKININKYIDPLLSIVGLKDFFEKYPVLLNSTNIKLKEVLGYRVK